VGRLKSVSVSLNFSGDGIESNLTYPTYKEVFIVKALTKIDRVERIYKKLDNCNRSIESYKDDLFQCFIECWSVKEWLINDGELKEQYPYIKDMVEKYIKLYI